jgi:hypothetical protein
VDRTTTIIRYQWRAYWRGLSRRGKVTAGNEGIALLILVLVFLRYLQWLRIATINLSQGKTALLEALLAGIFFAWLFSLGGAGQTSVATRRWLHLPLSLKELFRVRVISQLMPPSSWLVIAASLTVCYPLAHAKRPVVGIVAALLFIAMSGLIGLTVSHLISSAFWRRVLVTVAAVLLGAIGLAVNGSKGLLQFSTFMPSTLVARAAVGQRSSIAIVILAALCVVAYSAALWSFRLSLENTASRSSEPNMTLAPFRFPGRLGGLVGKDFRYFRRLLDVYMGLLAAAAGCVYLVTAGVPSRGVFLAFISIVFLLGAAVPFNSFGLDTRAGLDRYALPPLSGKSILLSKNLAYVIIMSGEIFPLIFLAGWRLGISAGAFGLMEAAALACAYLTWGNWMSVNQPLKMQFFRFASSGAALADAMAGVVFGSLPGILIIYWLHTQGDRADWKILAVVLLFGALYWASVARFGSRLEQRRERIAQALS